MSDDELLSGLDQPLPSDAFNALEVEIDLLYALALEDKKPYLILNKARELIGGFRASGLALAKIFYRLHKDWEKFGVADHLTDVIRDYTGFERVTVDRYISVWAKYEEGLIPPSLQGDFRYRPMKDQVAIAKTLDQGYEIGEDEWQQLANAPDQATVGIILRDIKGTPMRKGGILITLKRSGDLIAWSNDEQKFLGWLNIEEAKDDEVVAKAIDRILSSSNIRRE